jgi:type IV pilus assembly protein PilA
MLSMKKVQRGFTLIELMIVVAIIGILAAIALPAYMDYTARAQAAEALTATAGIRADIAVYLSENGDFVGIDTDTAMTESLENLGGKYFTAGTVELTVGETTMTISVPFSSGVHNGDTMTISPEVSADGQIQTWVCDGLLSKYLPAACRPAAGG